jgi:hypothetical protein
VFGDEEAVELEDVHSRTGFRPPGEVTSAQVNTPPAAAGTWKRGLPRSGTRGIICGCHACNCLPTSPRLYGQV